MWICYTFLTIAFNFYFFHFYLATGHVRRECKIYTTETRTECELDQAPDVHECLFCNTDGCNGVVKYGPIPVIIVIPLIIMKIFSIPN